MDSKDGLKNKEIKEAEDQIVDLLAKQNFSLAEVILILEDIKFKAFIGRETLKAKVSLERQKQAQESSSLGMYR